METGTVFEGDKEDEREVARDMTWAYWP